MNQFWLLWFVIGIFAMPISWAVANGFGWNFDPVVMISSGGKYKSARDEIAAKTEESRIKNAKEAEMAQIKRAAEQERNEASRAERESKERATEAAQKAESDQRWKAAEGAVAEENEVKAMKKRLGNVDDTVLWAYLYCSKMDSTNDIRQSIDFASIGAFGAWNIREYNLQVGSERAAQICPQHIR
jgi:hypothetical protein